MCSLLVRTYVRLHCDLTHYLIFAETAIQVSELHVLVIGCGDTGWEELVSLSSSSSYWLLD